MPRRFSALVTAESIDEVAHYARQIVQQLRSVEVPLDYGRLAGQLYVFQYSYLRDRVRLEWAREFAQWRPQQDEKDEG
jgi:CRISPR system Cascade subunit CasB